MEYSPTVRGRRLMREITRLRHQATHPASEPATAMWRKSSHSNAGNQCVEVAQIGAGVAVRDSKNPAGGHLTFETAEWKAFLGRIKHGSYDQ